MPSVFTQEQLSQQIAITLGETLSESELQSCIKTVEIVEPPVGKLFWQAADSHPGIYIILAGKVRLQDNSGNLIITLSAGASFGETTLFSKEKHEPYAARASTNLKLCYLKQEALQALINKYPQIYARLKASAEIWDLLLLYRQNAHSSAEGILKALSLFERHNLEIGSEKSVPQDAKLWLLYQGQLLHSNGYCLTPGKICGHPKRGNWQATEPTIAYILRDSEWQTVLVYWSELAELITSDSSLNDHQTSLSASKPEGFANGSNIIPFPQPDIPPKQKQKVRRTYFPSPRVTIGHVWGQLTHRYPFFAQQSASDCGVACLVMISRYWGKRFSVNRLRDLANVNLSGASLRSLTAAAESIGFATRPVKASLDKLREQPLPAIAHWEGKHYIVVYEITSKRVIVGDPAIGQRSLTLAEFQADWTGYALLLQPTALLKDAQEESTPIWKFLELVSPHARILLEVLIASVVIQVLGLVTPLLTQLLLDRVIVQGSTLTLNAVGFGLLIFSLFRIAMNGVRQYLLDHTANRLGLALMVGFIQHTFRLPLAFFESRYVGDIVSRVQENQKIQRFLTGEALSIILDLLTVFIYVGLMFWYSSSMALLCLTIIPPFFLLALVATPFFHRINREVFNALANDCTFAHF